MGQGEVAQVCAFVFEFVFDCVLLLAAATVTVAVPIVAPLAFMSVAV